MSWKQRVFKGVGVLRGAAADITGYEVYSSLRAGLDTGSYFTQLGGPSGRLNGELLRLEHDKPDYNGGLAVRSSTAYLKALKVAQSVSPAGMVFYRQFVSALPPGCGYHAPHDDIRNSRWIVAVKVINSPHLHAVYACRYVPNTSLHSTTTSTTAFESAAPC
jgi:hypothetical protein